jgi:hypothetical protein
MSYSVTIFCIEKHSLQKPYFDVRHKNPIIPRQGPDLRFKRDNRLIDEGVLARFFVGRDRHFKLFFLWPLSDGFLPIRYPNNGHNGESHFETA